MDTVNTTDASTRDTLLLEVLTLARRYAGRVARAAHADDIAQEVVLECLTRLDSGRWHVTTDLPSFVRRMVQSKRAGMKRTSVREDKRNGEYARAMLEYSPEWMCSEHAQESQELTKLHDQTVASLPPTCRTAYRMVREECATYRAVARTMGIGLATVRHHVATAERKVLCRLRKEGVEVRQRQRAVKHEGTAPTAVRSTKTTVPLRGRECHTVASGTQVTRAGVNGGASAAPRPLAAKAVCADGTHECAGSTYRRRALMRQSGCDETHDAICSHPTVAELAPAVT